MAKALQQQPQPPTHHRRKNILAFKALSSPFSSCVVDDVTRRLFNSERRSQSRENAVESVAETKISLSGIFEYFRHPQWFLCLCTYSCFNDSVVVEQQIFHEEWVKGILKSGWNMPRKKAKWNDSASKHTPTSSTACNLLKVQGISQFNHPPQLLLLLLKSN